MAYEVTSAEVAEDYKLALEDLTSNLRHEISNLTLIARENTEHAHAISEVLIDHIKKVGRIPAPSASLLGLASSSPSQAWHVSSIAHRLLTRGSGTAEQKAPSSLRSRLDR
jgi:hypothetical protein